MFDNNDWQSAWGTIAPCAQIYDNILPKCVGRKSMSLSMWPKSKQNAL